MVIWELFEFGSQPHRHLSDDEVLTFVIRERQITLAQPRLKLSHADYWSVCHAVHYYLNSSLKKRSDTLYLVRLDVFNVYFFFPPAGMRSCSPAGCLCLNDLQ